MARKPTSLVEVRKSGLDLCDALVADLCMRGLLTVTPEVLVRLQEYERGLQSYKLMRFSREVAALRTRFEISLRGGSVSSEVLTTRLYRLQAAADRLRLLLNDPTADAAEIEELAGKTWRDSNLDVQTNVLLAEIAWDSVSLEEGFRIDSSYFLGRAGEVFCERKIIPTSLFAPIDRSFKLQHPVPRYYPSAAFYPGDAPRRIKLPAGPVSETPVTGSASHHKVLELLQDAPRSLDTVRSLFTARFSRPFPPDAYPIMLASPVCQYLRGAWWVGDERGEWIRTAPAPGLARRPTSAACSDAFENVMLSSPVDALLLLLFDDGFQVAAAPVGAVTPEAVIRFGIDAL